jgi:hypothetical protein
MRDDFYYSLILMLCACIVWAVVFGLSNAKYEKKFIDLQQRVEALERQD